MTTKQVLDLYEQFNGRGVDEIMRHYHIPKCDYGVRLAQRIWGKLGNLKKYHDQNLPGLFRMEEHNLEGMLAALRGVDLGFIHQELKKLDAIFDNTH